MQIVAPAGSYSALRAAVNAGADAVYLGMPNFGARAKAENFDLLNLKSAIDYAHLFGVKVFITFNTLIKDTELNEALELADYAYRSGADCAIVQDLRFIELLKSKLPSFTLHASTQMGIHNADGAKVLLDMGIQRAVLARETLPKDIEQIKKTGIEIEFFVQGALCICFSGNCYFSSLASSYSGNRGKCMQLCRKLYKFNNKNGYFLSAKDICLYDKLAYLNELGVDAVKIEGRMRSVEYVTQAVSVYRSNLPTDNAVNALKSVFNRGDYCSAYIDSDAPFNIIYPKAQSNIGISLGSIEKFNGKKIATKVPIHADDGFKILRNGVEVGGASVRGGEVVADLNCAVGDELRRTFDGALSERLKIIKKSLPIDVAVTMEVNRLPCVLLRYGNCSVKVIGDSVPQTAISRAITDHDVERAFLKVSEFPFDPNIKSTISGNIFMPISALNELRRKAYEKLSSEIIQSNFPMRHSGKPFKLIYNMFKGKGIMLMVEDFGVLTKEIVAMTDYIALNPRDLSNLPIKPDFIDKPLLLNLPIAVRGEDREILLRAVNSDIFDGVISNNLYGLNITDKPILLGVGHNIIGKSDYSHICSFEADKLTDGDWAYAFGFAPLMTLCHCPYQKCIKCSGDDVLIDERNRKFHLRRYKMAHCYWQLLNCVPHYLDFADDKTAVNKFYDFTGVSTETILSVLNGDYSGAYTRGNINKGLK